MKQQLTFYISGWVLEPAVWGVDVPREVPSNVVLQPVKKERVVAGKGGIWSWSVCSTHELLQASVCVCEGGGACHVVPQPTRCEMCVGEYAAADMTLCMSLCAYMYGVSPQLLYCCMTLAQILFELPLSHAPAPAGNLGQ